MNARPFHLHALVNHKFPDLNWIRTVSFLAFHFFFLSLKHLCICQCSFKHNGYMRLAALPTKKASTFLFPFMQLFQILYDSESPSHRKCPFGLSVEKKKEVWFHCCRTNNGNTVVELEARPPPFLFLILHLIFLWLQSCSSRMHIFSQRWTHWNASRKLSESRSVGGTFVLDLFWLHFFMQSDTMEQALAHLDISKQFDEFPLRAAGKGVYSVKGTHKWKIP